MKTVTVGIPAHNEEANIVNLIRSVLAQETDGFTLEKVIVVCDGCTDRTAYRVEELARIDSRIKLVDDGKRKGKMKRLMEIYALNKSDAVVVFDADVVLAGRQVIVKMLEGFEDGVVLVGGNNQPVAPDSFVGKLINTWSHVWYEARLNYNGGDNVHNIRGCVLALENKFAKSVVFPPEIASDAQYLYFDAKAKEKGFRLAREAVIWYRKPDNVGDYMLQAKRSTPENEKLARIFGKKVYQAYRIPRRYKLQALLKMMILNPIWTPLSAAFWLFSILFPYKPKPLSLDNGGVWEVVSSTKRGIEVPNS